MYANEQQYFRLIKTTISSWCIVPDVSIGIEIKGKSKIANNFKLTTLHNLEREGITTRVSKCPDKSESIQIKISEPVDNKMGTMSTYTMETPSLNSRDYRYRQDYG